jgi:hypothetical protein
MENVAAQFTRENRAQQIHVEGTGVRAPRLKQNCPFAPDLQVSCCRNPR